jgi:tetratricopeptide (TPR) repeat protein
MVLAFEGCISAGKGKLSRALDLLRESGTVLRDTTDFTWLGNIQLAYGRIALEEGRYESAIGHFLEAETNFRQCDPAHRSLAETLTSLARTRRLIALRAAKVIDSQAARQRRLGPADAATCTEVSARREVDELRRQAEANLKEAMEVCALIGDDRASALAQVEHGLLLMDCSQFDRSSINAGQAFDSGWRAKDYMVLASARLLQCRIEFTQYEEGIGNAPLLQVHRASDYAKEAAAYARQSGDGRLVAGALIWQGLVYCSEFCRDAEGAEACCREAGELLAPGNGDDLWEEHRTLARSIVRGGRVDSRLREWSQGLVSDKSFQQMTEEFADMVIPLLWEKEGRNVSRVVAKLSISPKKVRRILSRAGLKGGA